MDSLELIGQKMEIEKIINQNIKLFRSHNKLLDWCKWTLSEMDKNNGNAINLTYSIRNAEFLKKEMFEEFLSY